jgi:hypothetical protein
MKRFAFAISLFSVLMFAGAPSAADRPSKSTCQMACCADGCACCDGGACTCPAGECKGCAHDKKSDKSCEKKCAKACEKSCAQMHQEKK